MKESLEWGTKIVGGVKPGVEGEHLGLPVFPSVKAVRIHCFVPESITDTVIGPSASKAGCLRDLCARKSDGKGD